MTEPFGMFHHTRNRQSAHSQRVNKKNVCPLATITVLNNSSLFYIFNQEKQQRPLFPPPCFHFLQGTRKLQHFYLDQNEGNKQSISVWSPFRNRRWEISNRNRNKKIPKKVENTRHDDGARAENSAGAAARLRVTRAPHTDSHTRRLSGFSHEMECHRRSLSVVLTPAVRKSNPLPTADLRPSSIIDCLKRVSSFNLLHLPSWITTLINCCVWL